MLKEYNIIPIPSHARPIIMNLVCVHVCMYMHVVRVCVRLSAFNTMFDPQFCGTGVWNPHWR